MKVHVLSFLWLWLLASSFLGKSSCIAFTSVTTVAALTKQSGSLAIGGVSTLATENNSLPSVTANSSTSTSSPCPIALQPSQVVRRKWENPLSSLLAVRFVMVALAVVWSVGRQRAVQGGVSLEKPMLGVSNIVKAALLLLSLAISPLHALGVSSLSRSLLVAASRCAIQVFLLGSILLERLLGVSHPSLVALWVLTVGFVASREAYSRVQYVYPRMRRQVFLSIITSGGSVLAIAIALQILGVVRPWYYPRTWIPVAGMLFGNCLTATALATSALTRGFLQLQDVIELRLARGATWREAVAPIVHDTLYSALTPTINSLTVTGIVHIPGMMTGQILAGQSARQAAAYQIVMNVLIATTSSSTVLSMVLSAIGTLVDTDTHRLRHTLISPKKPTKRSVYEQLKSAWDVAWSGSSSKEGQPATTTLVDSVSWTELTPSYSTNQTKYHAPDSTDPILTIADLKVPRANKTVSLIVRRGDRVGLVGPSGVGKSQILRTIAGMEEPMGGEMYLHTSHDSQEKMPLPMFRTKVIFVPQGRPNLQGTPQNFFEEVSQFECQRTKGPDAFLSILDIAKPWGIRESMFHQPWSTLSGGEAQRIMLAIALAFKPSVVLLDESTSALDDTTSRAVENTLMEMDIPVIMVTHSKEQLKRFCNVRMEF